MSNNFLPDDYKEPEIECPITTMYEKNEKGSHSHFVRVGLTMSPDMLKYLKHALVDLKSLGYPCCDLSSFIREACKEHLIKVAKFKDQKLSDERIDLLNQKAEAIEDYKHEKLHTEYLERMESN